MILLVHPRGSSRILCVPPRLQSPDTDTPSDVSSLEALLNDPRDSAATIRFARSLTCRELMAAEDFYSPFINGCGRCARRGAMRLLWRECRQWAVGARCCFWRKSVYSAKPSRCARQCECQGAFQRSTSHLRQLPS